MNKKKKKHFINEEIRGSEVRLTDKGIVTLQEALALAREAEMDLVLLNATSSPPVCKIMNYEKFIYDLDKKPKNKVLEVKEIKLGPNISENDLNYRVKHIKEFLDKGHKVKVSMQFKGREIAFIDKGKSLVLNLIISVEESGSAESLPVLEGKKLYVIIKPKKQ